VLFSFQHSCDSSRWTSCSPYPSTPFSAILPPFPRPPGRCARVFATRAFRSAFLFPSVGFCISILSSRCTLCIGIPSFFCVESCFSPLFSLFVLPALLVRRNVCFPTSAFPFHCCLCLPPKNLRTPPHTKPDAPPPRISLYPLVNDFFLTPLICPPPPSPFLCTTTPLLGNTRSTSPALLHSQFVPTVQRLCQSFSGDVLSNSSRDITLGCRTWPLL